MIFLLKIVVALLMLSITAVATFFFGIFGFLLALAMTIVLHNVFNRWEKRRAAATN